MPKKNSPKQVAVPGDILCTVLEDVSKERLATAIDLLHHNANVNTFNREATEQLKPLVEEVDDAKAELRAADRLKGRVSAQDHSALRGKAHKRVQAAEAALNEARAKRQPRNEALNQAGRKLLTRADELEAEWRVHERQARAAGIDTAVFWTPDKPLPDEAPTADADDESGEEA